MVPNTGEGGEGAGKGDGGEGEGERRVQGETRETVLLLTWPPLSVEVLQGWRPLLQLGVPSAISLLIEWGGFELNAILAGHLGIDSIATHSVFVCLSFFPRFFLLKRDGWIEPQAICTLRR